MPDIGRDFRPGKVASGAFLGALSVGGGFLNAASMSYRPARFGLFLQLCFRDFRPTPKEYVELAKPNFQYEKRQKELAKKKKQEEKRLKKLAAKATGEPEAAEGQPPEAETAKPAP